MGFHRFSETRYSEYPRSETINIGIYPFPVMEKAGLIIFFNLDFVNFFV